MIMNDDDNKNNDNIASDTDTNKEKEKTEEKNSTQIELKWSPGTFTPLSGNIYIAYDLSGRGVEA